MKRFLKNILIGFVLLNGLLFISGCVKKTNKTDNSLNDQTEINNNQTSSNNTKTEDIIDNTETNDPIIDESYTITWKNYNGDILKTDNYKKGTMPKYEGDIPTKEATKEHVYNFIGWDKELVKVDKDYEYVAKFEESDRYYTYRFYYGNEIIKEDTIKYGTTYEAPELKLQNTDQYTYEFQGFYDKPENGEKVETFPPIEEDVSYYAYVNVGIKGYLITFNNYDGSFLEDNYFKYGNMPEYRGETPKRPTDDTYRYYFVGWTEELTPVTGKKTYTAAYDAVLKTEPVKQYKITWKNYDNSILKEDIINEYEMPEYNGATPTREKQGEITYIFNGWTPKVTYASNDITYTATYLEGVRTKYIVEHKFEDPNSFGYLDETIVEEMYGISYTLTDAKPRVVKGYNANSFKQETINEDGSTKITIYYSLVENMIDIIDADDSIEYFNGFYDYDECLYPYEKIIELEVELYEGYVFDGWYINGTKVSDNCKLEYEMPDYDIEIEAKTKPNKYEVIINNNTNFNILGADSYESYDYNSKIKLYSDNLPSRYYLKWTRLDTLEEIISTDFEFNVPIDGIEINVEFSIYSKTNDEDTNYIYFGAYPQTLVDDNTLTSSLNKLAGTLPNEDGDHKWIDYEFYNEGVIESYAWYIDIDLNNDGIYDYRGVYFLKYRPTSCQAPSTSSDVCNYGYQINQVYWFKYEPIKWKVLKTTNNKALIWTDSIIDVNHFQYIDPENIVEDHCNAMHYHNGVKAYMADYRASDIRLWLMNKFYNSAFSGIEKTIIENSNTLLFERMPYYGYLNDKVLLLSMYDFEEVFGLGNFDETSSKLPTDYSKCMGSPIVKNIHDESAYTWWSLTPSTSYMDCIRNGQIDVRSEKADKLSGIMPAIWINLDKLDLNPTLENDGYTFINKPNVLDTNFNRISKETVLETYVDDVFTIQESIVATTKILRGSVRVGDIINIYVSRDDELIKYEATVAGIEMYRKPLDYASTGDTVGLYIEGDFLKEDILIGSLITNVEIDSSNEYYLKINPTINYEFEYITVNSELMLGIGYYYNDTYKNLYITSMQIEAIYGNDLAPIDEINETKEYIIKIKTPKQYYFYEGYKGKIYRNGQVISTYEVISNDYNYIDVFEYANNHNKYVELKILGNNDSYVKNDYIKLKVPNTFRVEDFYNTYKNEFENPGYEFIGLKFYTANNEEISYDLIKNSSINVLEFLKITTEWQQISFTSKIESKEIIDEMPSITIVANFKELYIDDSINIVLKDYSVKTVKIIKIIRNDQEVESTAYDTSLSNVRFKLVLDGIDYDDIALKQIAYK